MSTRVHREVRVINYLKLKEANEKPFTSKGYKALKRIIIVTSALYMPFYMLRENLYKLDNQYITLLAGTAPNLIPSFLFTLAGMFYAIPFFIGIESINKSRFIWLINVLNLIIFAFIEYLHVVFNIGLWDNNDIIASVIGIAASTVIYFKLRNSFIR
jgi:glycopeptide antibiotics resistance protein